MEGDALLGHAQSALWTAAWVSAPILLPVLVVGLVIGLVQAMTSINEQTLTFVPKLVVVAAILGLFGAALFGMLSDFAREMFAAIPRIVA